MGQNPYRPFLSVRAYHYMSVAFHFFIACDVMSHVSYFSVSESNVYEFPLYWTRAKSLESIDQPYFPISERVHRLARNRVVEVHKIMAASNFEYLGNFRENVCRLFSSGQMFSLLNWPSTYVIDETSFPSRHRPLLSSESSPMHTYGCGNVTASKD